MGWGRMFLLGDVGQQLDIQDTQRALAQIGTQLRATGRFDQEVAERLDRLAAENAELKLYVVALMRLLVEKGTVTRSELEQIVDRIDAADGQRDRKFNGNVRP